MNLNGYKRFCLHNNMNDAVIYELGDTILPCANMVIQIMLLQKIAN